MMIAWLVWYDADARAAGDKPEFHTQEPNSWECYEQIVYAKVVA